MLGLTQFSFGGSSHGRLGDAHLQRARGLWSAKPVSEIHFCQRDSFSLDPNRQFIREVVLSAAAGSFVHR